jgi:hypothetical protein
MRLTPVSSTREFRERPDDRSGAPPGHLSRRRAGWSRRHGNRKRTVHGTHGYRLGNCRVERLSEDSTRLRTQHG